jgi:Pentapeptide repeats (8 copies)
MSKEEEFFPMSKEQLKVCRERWKFHSGLAEEIRKILQNGLNKPIGLEDGIERLKEVQNLLIIKNEGLSGIDKEKYSFDIAKPKIQHKDSMRLENPVLDLNGISWDSEPFLCFIFLRHARMKGANLRGASLEYANLEYVDLEEAYLTNANLFDVKMKGSNLVNSHLEVVDFGAAKLEEGRFAHSHLNGAQLYSATLDGADFSWADLRGVDMELADLVGTDFTNAYFGRLDKIKDEWNLTEEHEETIVGRTTRFNLNIFLPNISISLFSKSGWNKLKTKEYWKTVFDTKRIFSRWFYTDFEDVRIDDADTVMAPDLFRYVKDQQFLRRFKRLHPTTYWIWKIFSDCGGSGGVVAFWSIITVLLFAFFYSIPPIPIANWVPDFLVIDKWLIESQPINPDLFFNEVGTSQNELGNKAKYIFISFDVFTNLGIRATNPQNWVGVLLIFAETCMGFVSLGMLLSVLANKFARRS